MMMMMMMMIITKITIIATLFKSQGYLAEHECSTNCGGYKLTEIRTNQINSRFSHDITAAMLVSPNKETAAMLVS